MKRYHLLTFAALFLALISAGCNGLRSKDGETAADAISDSLLLDSADYITDTDTVSAEVRIHVEFLTGSSPLAVSLRKHTAQRMASLLNGVALDCSQSHKYEVKAPTNLNSTADMQRMVDIYGAELTRQLASYTRELNANVGEEYALTMSVDNDFRLLCEADSFVTFINTAYYYMGGAHGMTGVDMQTFVRSTGLPLTDIVDTLQIEAMQPLLREGICLYLNRWNDGEGYGENDSISPATLHHYLFEDNMLAGGLIPLPATQPALTLQGVQFVYSQYEIAPYAAGNITFTVPYEKIRPFLTPQTLTLLP